MTNGNSLHNIATLDKFATLTEDEMMAVEGGIGPIGIGVLLWLAKDAWSHTDQIINGFKKGFGK
jgi:bacteriocin-like protein